MNAASPSTPGSDIYPCFLSGSGQFFVFILLFFISLLIFFLLTWATVGHFSALSLPLLHHCLQFGLELELFGPHRQAWRLCGGGALLGVLSGGGGLLSACAREWVTLLRHSPWLWLVVLIQSSGCLQIKLGPLGGATDSVFLYSWTVSYCTVRSWWQF